MSFIAVRCAYWAALEGPAAVDLFAGRGRSVGRVGALAVALGIGAAIVSLPGVAFADTTTTAGEASSESRSSMSSPGTATSSASGLSVDAGSESLGSTSGLPRSQGSIGDPVSDTDTDTDTDSDDDVSVIGSGANDDRAAALAGEIAEAFGDVEDSEEGSVATSDDDKATVAESGADFDSRQPLSGVDVVAESGVMSLNQLAERTGESTNQASAMPPPPDVSETSEGLPVGADESLSRAVSVAVEATVVAESAITAGGGTGATSDMSIAPAKLTPAVVSDAADAVYPGVDQAIQQLSAAQSELTEGTWGNGNLLAGFAALLPQLLIATAQTSLRTWVNSNDDAVSFFAATEGKPFAHGLARLNLAANETLPAIAQAAMRSAQGLLPVVGWFGAFVPAENAGLLVADAQQNGMVYGTVPFWTEPDSTGEGAPQPYVHISVNGGPFVPVTLDTGSRGLIIDPDYVGIGDLGPIDNSACAVTSGDHCAAQYGEATDDQYEFDTYTTTVAFGNGIVTAPTYVGILTPDPQNLAHWRAIHNEGVAGTLGVGVNTPGPIGGPEGSVISALPGELNRGMLLSGSRGHLVFGPNPLPARSTLSGLPHTEAVVRFNDGEAVPVHVASFDSGGDYGAFTNDLVPETWQELANVPSGTEISVYALDGETLLYSYVTNEENSPAIIDTPNRAAYFNTGYQPYQSASIYTDLRWNSDKSQAGSVSFNYPWWRLTTILRRYGS